MTDQPLSPVQIETKLRQLVSELTRAENMLRDARDTEVACIHDYQAAKRKALLSGECPKVARGGYTTAERDAWVDEQCASAQFAAALATAAREAAQDHLRVVRDQASIVQSLGASVRVAYSTAGAS